MKFFLAALLIIGAFAAQDEVIARIKAIDSTKFGRALFDTLYLQMEANDPLDTLIGTLHDLEDRYIREQKEDDAANRDFQDACNVDIAAYDKDLSESNAEKIRLEARLEGELYPRREIAQQVVNEQTRLLNRQKAELAQFLEEVAVITAEFEQKIAEHVEAIEVLTQVKHLFIQEFNLDAAFVQKLQSHLQSAQHVAKKYKHKKHFAHLFKALMTITTRMTQVPRANYEEKFQSDAASKIVELTESLIAGVQESLDTLRFEYNEFQRNNQRVIKRWNTSIAITETALAAATSELNAIQAVIKSVEESLDNTNQRIEQLTEARTDRFNQCEEAVRDYAEQRDTRDEQRAVVSDAIGLVNTALRTLKEQIALRIAAGEKFD